MPAPRRNAEGQRRAELARIHILADELGLDREQYEAVIWTHGRVESSALLDSHGRGAVIKHLAAQVARKNGTERTVNGRAPRTLATRPMLRKIEAQLAEAKRAWEYAESLVQRICGKDALEFCSDEELGKIIAALAVDARRNGRRVR